MNTINMVIPSPKGISMSIGRDDDISLKIKSSSGTSNYNALTNKPSINGVTLIDDKSLEELGVNTMTNFEILEIVRRVFGG